MSTTSKSLSQIKAERTQSFKDALAKIEAEYQAGKYRGNDLPEGYVQDGGASAYEGYAALENELKKQRDQQINYADQIHTDAYKSAAVARERSIVDAKSAYAQNGATRGVNAEALARMGLTGSGYSDYLQGNAYATMRGEVAGAKAQELSAQRNADLVRDQTKLSAQQNYTSAYTSLLEKQQAEALQRQQLEATEQQNVAATYAALLDAANNGSYTATQLEQLGKVYQIPDTMIPSLSDAATAYKVQAAESEIQSALSTGTTIAEIEKLAGNGGVSSESTAAYIKQLENSVSTSFAEYLNGTDEKAIATAQAYADQQYNNGNGSITKETYQKLYLDSFMKEYEDASEEDMKKAIKDLESYIAQEKIADSGRFEILSDMYAKIPRKSLSQVANALESLKEAKLSKSEKLKLENIICSSAKSYCVEEVISMRTDINKADIKIGGEKYRIVYGGGFGKTPVKKMQAALTTSFGSEPKEGDLVELYGKVYIYRDDNSKFSAPTWYEITEVIKPKQTRYGKKYTMIKISDFLFEISSLQ